MCKFPRGGTCPWCSPASTAYGVDHGRYHAWDSYITHMLEWASPYMSLQAIALLFWHIISCIEAYNEIDYYVKIHPVVCMSFTYRICNVHPQSSPTAPKGREKAFVHAFNKQTFHLQPFGSG